jgi:hypothetical protein
MNKTDYNNKVYKYPNLVTRNLQKYNCHTKGHISAATKKPTAHNLSHFSLSLSLIKWSIYYPSDSQLIPSIISVPLACSDLFSAVFSFRPVVCLSAELSLFLFPTRVLALSTPLYLLVANLPFRPHCPYLSRRPLSVVCQFHWPMLVPSLL